MKTNPFCVFSLKSGKYFAEKTVAEINVRLADHEERDFEDGEHKIRPIENVRNKDVYVVQSLHSDPEMSVNDKLCRLMFFIGALKESSAAKVTAIIPYLCYARKDRKTKQRDPVTTKYVARLLETSGVDHVVTLDVHNLQAFQNSFRCYTDHLEAKALFACYVKNNIKESDVVVLSPDAGGMKRAEAFSEVLSKSIGTYVPVTFMEKKRSMGVVSGSALVGNVEGKSVIVIDDLISSGTTLSRAAAMCKEAGAKQVLAMVTHGVFGSKANENLKNPALDKLILTNSIPLPEKLNPDLVKQKIVVLDVAPLIGRCIQCLQTGGSVTEIIEEL
ncbi:ribose-phosphate pyrophosphokinase [Cytophagaceae bacterium ABcell3]|nr:ribose-phosphate pyrophosphokinase [Cytophagaceae bacterium ABcell3]